LLGDDFLGYDIGQLAAGGIDLALRLRHHHLGQVHHRRIKKNHRLTRVILGAGTAKHADGGGLDQNRLAGERFVRQARDPIDRVLQPARNRVVVFRRDDDDAIGGFYGAAQRRDRCRKTARLYVGVIDRQQPHRGQRLKGDAGGRQCRKGPGRPRR